MDAYFGRDVKVSRYKCLLPVNTVVSVFKMPVRTFVTKLPVDQVYNLNKRC